jgi:predicted RNase H-like nuclease
VSTTDLQILGIDAAVDPRNVGMAVAVMAPDGSWQMTAVETGRRDAELSHQAAGLIDPGRPLLVAVDAPLGWPSILSASLAQHRAGQALEQTSDQLFTRQTDRHVRGRVGLKPLDVGADRIARTARAALALIERLRERTQNPLPLLMEPGEAAQGGLIEVYPAATLTQHGLPSKGYKKPAARELRETILEGFKQRLNPSVHKAPCLASDHCLDAALCVLTAIDFLAGACHPPQDKHLARSEGWIWFPSV